MLGDPERPAELRVLRVSEGVRELANRRRRDSGDTLALLERPRLDRLTERVVAAGRPCDELLVRETRDDDLACDRVRERDVGADVETEPEVGPLCRGRAAGIDDDQLRAAMDRLEHVVKEDRMRVAR